MNTIERPSTSESLLVLAKLGDSDAWTRISTIYGPSVFQLCRLRGLEPNDAADVTQDIFISIYKGLNRFQKTESHHSFMKWVLTISNNGIIDFFRRRGKAEMAFGGEVGQAWADGVVDVSSEVLVEQISLFRQQAATRILALLEQDFQENTFFAFYKTAVEHKTAAEAAEELGMTAGAVRVAKLRVKKRAQEVYGDLFR